MVSLTNVRAKRIDSTADAPEKSAMTPISGIRAGPRNRKPSMPRMQILFSSQKSITQTAAVEGNSVAEPISTTSTPASLATCLTRSIVPPIRCSAENLNYIQVARHRAARLPGCYVAHAGATVHALDACSSNQVGRACVDTMACHSLARVPLARNRLTNQGSIKPTTSPSFAVTASY